MSLLKAIGEVLRRAVEEDSQLKGDVCGGKWNLSLAFDPPKETFIGNSPTKCYRNHLISAQTIQQLHPQLQRRKVLGRSFWKEKSSQNVCHVLSVCHARRWGVESTFCVVVGISFEITCSSDIEI